MALPVSSALYKKIYGLPVCRCTVGCKEVRIYSLPNAEDASTSAANKEVAKEIGTAANKQMNFIRRGSHIHNTVTKLEPR